MIFQIHRQYWFPFAVQWSLWSLILICGPWTPSEPPWPRCLGVEWVVISGMSMVFRVWLVQPLLSHKQTNVSLKTDKYTDSLNHHLPFKNHTSNIEINGWVEMVIVQKPFPWVQGYHRDPFWDHLFSYYINHPYLNLSCQNEFYADDTSIFTPGSTISEIGELYQRC